MLKMDANGDGMILYSNFISLLVMYFIFGHGQFGHYRCAV